MKVDSKEIKYWFYKSMDEFKVPLAQRQAVIDKIKDLPPPMTRRDIEDDVLWAVQELGL